ncbi:ATP-binding cassette domain-containing protein [Streptomyces sp. NPDC060053]|uniref:ATP-binding cassette domain-containing protein n=1 Tax=Streptomyces sp. NPDC060053 TaxID=3347047 RepID=UPI0036A210EE
MPFSVMRHMWRLSYRAAPAMAFANIALIALIAGAVALTALGQRLVVDSAGGHAVGAVLVAALLGLLAHTATFALTHVQGEVSQDLTVRVARALDLEILALTTSIPTLRHLEHADFLDRVTNLRRGTQALATSIWRTAQALATLISIGLSVWLLAGIHPVLPLLALCAVPVLVLAGRGRRHVRLVRDQVAENDRYERAVHEMCLSPAHAMELRIAGSGAEMSRRADRAWQDTTHRLVVACRRALVYEATGWLLFTAALGGATALVLHLYTIHQAGLGDLVLLITLGTALSGQIHQTMASLSVVAEAGHVTRHYLWLKRYAASQPTGGRAVPEHLTSGIGLRGITFGYPGSGTPVLEDVDLDLPAGSIVGLVGINGAGKTTLVKLLTGLYRPDRGTVTVDGVPLADIAPDRWAASCTGVFQDFAKLQLLVRENVGIGDVPRMDNRAAVTDAVARSGAAPFVSALPDGLESQLGARFEGTDLSYGQWQKLALARGLLRRRCLLLVLDEPTSALDPQAEHDLFERFIDQSRAAAARHGAVTVLVSHRFSTLHMADHIVVLHGGHVVEQGDHAALLAADGVYAEHYTAQAATYR